MKTPNRFGFSSNNGANNSGFDNGERLPEEAADSSPDRIANALKQGSPLRKKLANDTLSMNRGPSVNDVEHNPYPSKITHVNILLS